MKRRRMTMFAGLFAAIATALLLPRAAFACQLTDPGCYIDDFAHKQLYQFDLSIWQINRAGLVLARWLEDVRVWLTDSVFTDAFTTLTQPVKFAFYLALILAWLVFIVSFMVQQFIDLRWVDLRRATRPILLAVFIFTFGGSLLKGTEQARLIGGTILQQAASEAVQAAEAPQVPTQNTGDMADASSSIYNSATSCGTPARSQSAMFLNDYSARYLWSNAEDVHCADVIVLAGEFYNKYFPYGQDVSNEPDGNKRQQAVAWAARGGLRQVTGVFMMAGAIIEQIVQLIFAVALALVWFGILISLVFAVFVPTEELFSSQIKALLSVLRASWLASFLIGLGLAVLQIVAKSGNGFLVLICGLVLIAVAVWQGKQALETMNTALSAASAATGSAPQAVGGMIKGWATTAALVGGVALTGGGFGAALTSVGSTMVRRAGRSVGDNPISEAAGRVLSNRVADRLDNYTQDQRMVQDAKLDAAEAAWYERRTYEGVGIAEVDAQAAADREAANARVGQQLALLKERQAERARKEGNFRKADKLRREARDLRGVAPARPADATAYQPEPLDMTEMDRALEQLQEAHDDPEIQRRVLAETAARAQRRAQLKSMRNLALRDKRFDDAKAAIGELRDPPEGNADQETTAASAKPRRRARMVRGPSRRIKMLPPVLEPGRQAPAVALADTSAATGVNADDPNLVRFNPVSVSSSEVEATYLPAMSEALQDVRITYSPASGMSVNGIPVDEMRYSEDGRRATLRTATREITVANTWRGDLAKVHGREQKGQIARRSDLASRPAVAAPGMEKAAPVEQSIPGMNGTATATTGSAEHGASAVAQPTTSAPAATNGQQTTAAPSQGASVHSVSQVRAANTQDARPGVASNGTTSAAAAPVAAASASAPQVVPVVAPVPTVPVADGAVSPAVVTAPAVPPVNSTVPAATIAAPIDVSAAEPAPGASATPITPVIPAVVQPAPRSSNGLPVRGAGAPLAAAPVAPAAAVAAEERRPVAQPTRATTGPVLPTVAEVRGRPNGAGSRPETTPAVPVVPAPSTRTATTSRQPWKRRKQGDE